jgi:hypothetical protein
MRKWKGKRKGEGIAHLGMVEATDNSVAEL